MRTSVLIVLILAGLPLRLVAQLDVRLVAPHREVLQFEAMPVDLLVRNETGLTIEFGKYYPYATVRFEIRRSRDRFLSRRGESLFVTSWSVSSLKEDTRRVDMSRFFDVRTVGRYYVRALVKWRGKKYRSGEVLVDVVNGIELSSTERELPESPSIVRTYSLRYWNREDTEVLFLCVYDKKMRRSYGVYELGRIVRVFQPSIEFDSMGNIHVMHLAARDVISHSYFVATPTGVRYIDHAFRTPKGEPVDGKSDGGGIKPAAAANAK